MTRSRVAVYDLYWSTYGGGEQVAGAIAQTLAEDHDVVLLGPEPVDVDRSHERLGVDLSRCGFEVVNGDDDASFVSREVDLFVNSTYRSKAVNQAPDGWYYVHFPEPLPTWQQRLRQRVAVASVVALSLPPRLPPQLRRVLAGFDRRVERTDHLASYRHFLANSQFTAEWVEHLWDVEVDVLHPPVRPQAEPGDKRPIVLNVGRFFDPRFGHSKKQLELIEAFIGGGFDGWTLQLAGGCDASNREYALAVRRAALGRPIEVHVNAKGSVVRRLFAEAPIYWHGGGLSEDPDRHPERFEHFGITVVEAMAAGAVPIVYGAGGPAEIVEHGVNGFHWRSANELVDMTRALMDDPARLAELSSAARVRADDFSAAHFATEVRRLAGAGLAQTSEPT